MTEGELAKSHCNAVKYDHAFRNPAIIAALHVISGAPGFPAYYSGKTPFDLYIAFQPSCKIALHKGWKARHFSAYLRSNLRVKYHPRLR